jgi:hypothetical protein
MKRTTPMKRTPFRRPEHRVPKPWADTRTDARKCTGPNCEREFIPRLPLQAVCGPVCARRKVEAARKAKAKADKAKALEMKPLRYFVAKAQAAFNEYIRARDADLGCVSCGTTNPPRTRGGQWDAGHFLGRGAYPELRFHEDNCHKQCKSCNGGGGKFAHKERTVNEKAEPEILRRIGPERLAALKGPHTVEKLTRERLTEIAQHYRAKRRELEKQRKE